MGLPSIVVEFRKLASTARRRSERGILAVVVQDDTKVFASQAYAKAVEVKEEEYTAENYAAIQRAFDASPYKVIVVRVGTSDNAEKATKILDTTLYNWVCAIPTAFQTPIAEYVKKINTPTRARAAKAVVYGVESADDMHIVNMANESVTLVGETSPTAMNLYLPRMGGILAAQPMTGSVTFYPMKDLSDVAAVADPDASIDKGNVPLIKDDEVIRIGRGVTTLQTVSGEKTEEQKKIAVVESMDIIKEDMIRIFKNEYLGKVKNTASNQALLISSYLEYMQELAEEQIIDGEQEIRVEIDVDAMRAAWTAAGVDVSGLSDSQVKKKTFRASVFVSGSCHILDAMENINISITLA